MSRITPCLWFDGKAEEAAAFYASLLPDSRIESIMRAPADNPSTPKGAALVVEFTLAGRRFMGLNGGPQFRFSEAVSFVIECVDQDSRKVTGSVLRKASTPMTTTGRSRKRAT